jgi:peptidoglycan hydrolase CwlO-like protein
MEENIIHLIIAIISALSSVGAWRFYETKIKIKSAKYQNPQKANENFIADLQARVAKLETLLIESSEEKDEMRNIITDLSSEVSALKVKIKFLEEENTYLKGKKSRK